MNKINIQEKGVYLRNRSHMPSDSLFFEKIVPVLLTLMGLLMLGLVLFAAGVIFGLVHF